MSRDLDPAERSLLTSTRPRLLDLAMPAVDVDALLAVVAADLGGRRPSRLPPEDDRVDPRVVARAVAAVARPHLRPDRDLAPVRLDAATPRDLLRELVRRGLRRP